MRAFFIPQSHCPNRKSVMNAAIDDQANGRWKVVDK